MESQASVTHSPADITPSGCYSRAPDHSLNGNVCNTGPDVDHAQMCNPGSKVNTDTCDCIQKRDVAFLPMWKFLKRVFVSIGQKTDQ